MTEASVLVIVFNRPESTKKLFEALSIVQPKKLYVFSDAPRDGNVKDIQACEEVRQIISNINWKCDLNLLYQEKNLGCSLGPRTAFSWFFEHENEGIILEDDCIPHKDFFQFAAELLEKYRDNKRVLSISGSNLGYQTSIGDSYTFSRFMNMWGWATWKDRANSIDYELKSWSTRKSRVFHSYKLLRQNIFDLDINWYKYWADKFDRTLEKKNITWWDWQWIYHQLEHKQYTIVPVKNLITNIGFNEEATHTRSTDNPAANINAQSIKFPLIHPKEIKADFVFEEKHIKWTWCYHKRLPRKFYIKKYLANLLQLN